MPQPVRLRARVDSVRDHAPGLRTLILATERPVPPFLPGQFLQLALDEYDPSQHWPDSRAFSIANPPEERSRLQITLSEVGPFTRRMLRLGIGDHVWVKLPYGDFILDAAARSPVVLIAGGTGITAFASLLACQGSRIGPLRLLYGVRRPEFLVYRSVVEAAAQRWADFAWYGFVEEEAVPGFRHGRLSAVVALEAAATMADVMATTFFLSGPPGMVLCLRRDLAAAGVSPARIRIDAWS